MFQEINTLASRVVNTEKHWGLRKDSLPSHYLLSANDVKLILTNKSESNIQEFWDSFQLDLIIDSKVQPIEQVSITKRGRWRPNIPMFGINFLLEGKEKSFHLILKEFYKTPKNEFQKWTHLEMDDIFWSEYFCYSSLSDISSVCLRNQIADVEIITGTQNHYSKAIIVEDIEEAKLSRGEKPIDIDHGPIEAMDIFNLRFFQILVGNNDFAFDYDDEGIFKVHNVDAFAFNDSIVPFAFDFQTTLITAPKHPFYEQSSNEEHGIANAKYLNYLFDHSRPHINNSDYLDIICKQLLKLEKSSCSRPLKKSYISYYISVLEHFNYSPPCQKH